MQFSEEVNATLRNLIDDMTLDLSEFTVYSDRDFARKKKMGFSYFDKVFYFYGKPVSEK